MEVLGVAQSLKKYNYVKVFSLCQLLFGRFIFLIVVSLMIFFVDIMSACLINLNPCIYGSSLSIYICHKLVDQQDVCLFLHKKIFSNSRSLIIHECKYFSSHKTCKISVSYSYPDIFLLPFNWNVINVCIYMYIPEVSFIRKNMPSIDGKS